MAKHLLASAPASAPSDIDALAYRFWSIHPKELDDLAKTTPANYKGGVRAWFFATEMRKLLAASALRNAARKLANEVGALKAFEHEIRLAIGDTNWSVLIGRLDDMDAAISKAEGN